eukprot:4666599-Amphidinium_carterae.2
MVWCYHFRQYIGKSSQTAREIERTKSRLRRLRQKQPSKVTGRHVFVADAVQRNQEGTSHWRSGARTQQQVVQGHGQHWQSLSAARKSAYERQASLLRHERTIGIADAIATNREELVRLMDQHSQETIDKTPPGMLISRSIFEKDTLDKLQQLHESCLYAPSQVQQLRERFNVCPKPLSAEDYDLLCGRSILSTSVADSGTPGLVSSLCQNRDELKHSVLGVWDGYAFSWFAYVLGLQKPVTLILQPLVHLDITGPLLPTDRKCDWDDLQSQDYDWYWSFEVGVYSSGEALVDVAPENLYIVQDSIALKDTLLVSRSPLQQLTTAVDLTRRAAAAGTTVKNTGRASSSHAVPDMLHGPGIASLMTLTKSARKIQQKPQSQLHSSIGAGDAAHDTAQDGQDPDEERLPHAAVWHDLESQRVNLDISQDCVAEHFNIRIDGGDWQLQRTGREVYGMRCSTKRNTLVQAYCTQFGLKQSQAFEMNVHGAYGSVLGAVWRYIVFVHATHWERSERPALFPWASMPEPVLPEELRHDLEGISGRSRARLDAIMGMTPPR